MNNVNIKYLLCALGGMGIGYFLAQGRFEKYFKEQLELANEAADEHLQQSLRDQEIQLSEAYQKKLQLALNTAAEMDADLSAEDSVEDIYKPESVESEDVKVSQAAGALINYSGVPYNRVHLSSAAEEVGGSVPDAESLQGIVQNLTPSSIIPRSTRAAEEAEPPSVVVTEDEFMHETAGFKQYSLTYWAGDNILSGESDNKIDEDFRNDVLGSEIFDILIAGPEAFTGENLYVRNVLLQKEFEIEWRSEKYSDAVVDQTG